MAIDMWGNEIENQFRNLKDANKDQIIFFTNEKDYTYEEVWRRYQQLIRCYEKVPMDSLICLNCSDAVDEVVLYLVAAIQARNVLIIPQNITRTEWNQIKRAFQLTAEMPVDGFSVEDLDGHNWDLKGEVIFGKGVSQQPFRFVRISHKDFIEKILIRQIYDDTQKLSLEIIAFYPWRQIGLKEILRGLLLNQPVCIVQKDILSETMNFLRRYKITGIVLPSSMLSQILYHSNFQNESFRDLRKIRYCHEPMSMETVLKMQTLFPSVYLYSDYGLSETIGTIAVLGPEVHRQAIGKNYLPSVGRFMAGVESKIIDKDGKEVFGQGIGELTVHAEYQFQGFLGERKKDQWIRTGDMGWMDDNGYFNLSGFKKKIQEQSQGTLYVLPTLARKNITNIPLTMNSLMGKQNSVERFQNMLIFLHASLNPEEIIHFYMNQIPDIIRADAYGYESYPFEIDQDVNGNQGEVRWYQDAVVQANHHEILLSGEQRTTRLALNQLESYWREPVDILYIPLYSKLAKIHGAISFARISIQNSFMPEEITVIKQISHHLNMALLNAKTFREIEKRQMLLMQAMNVAEVGILLSDLEERIYYMNNKMSELISKEDVESFQNSFLLDRLRDNFRKFRQTDDIERNVRFGYYQQGQVTPIAFRMRSVRLNLESEYVITFVRPDFESSEIDFGDLGTKLSPKEQQVLSGLCKGLQYKEIAALMSISINTVNYHIKNIYRKMNVTSRSEIINSILCLDKNGFRYLPGKE